jgi:uncharacterized membrane protein (UPF0136 family)
MTIATILWIYIALLFVGGLMGFLKAGSKVSLYMSLGFGALLALCNIRGILDANFARNCTLFLLVVLLVVFGIRLGKTKKFMPAGMMLVVTLATLLLRWFR